MKATIVESRIEFRLVLNLYVSKYIRVEKLARRKTGSIVVGLGDCCNSNVGGHWI